MKNPSKLDFKQNRNWQALCQEMKQFAAYVKQTPPLYDMGIEALHQAGVTDILENVDRLQVVDLPKVREALTRLGAADHYHEQVVQLLARFDEWCQSNNFNKSFVAAGGVFAETSDYWEDAAAYYTSSEQAFFAVADGVGNSRFPEVLADAIVEGFCRQKFLKGNSFTQEDANFLRPVHDKAVQHYQKALKKNVFSYISKYKILAAPIASTFVGLKIFKGDEQNPQKFQFIGVGDSILFHFLRKKLKGKEFLVLKNFYPDEGFKHNHTTGTGQFSVSQDSVACFGELSFYEGECGDDDVFVLATDDVAKFIKIHQLDCKKDDWEELLNLKDVTHFKAFQKRFAPQLGGDDDTFIVVNVKSIFAPETVHPRHQVIVKSGLQNTDVDNLLAWWQQRAQEIDVAESSAQDAALNTVIDCVPGIAPSATPSVDPAELPVVTFNLWQTICEQAQKVVCPLVVLLGYAPERLNKDSTASDEKRLAAVNDRLWKMIGIALAGAGIAVVGYFASQHPGQLQGVVLTNPPLTVFSDGIAGVPNMAPLPSVSETPGSHIPSPPLSTSKAPVVSDVKVPIPTWVTGLRQDIADSTLSAASLEQLQYLDAEAVQALVKHAPETAKSLQSMIAVYAKGQRQLANMFANRKFRALRDCYGVAVKSYVPKDEMQTLNFFNETFQSYGLTHQFTSYQEAQAYITQHTMKHYEQIDHLLGLDARTTYQHFDATYQTTPGDAIYAQLKYQWQRQAEVLRRVSLSNDNNN